MLTYNIYVEQNVVANKCIQNSTIMHHSHMHKYAMHTWKGLITHCEIDREKKMMKLKSMYRWRVDEKQKPREMTPSESNASE